jgi:hypothetical protein
MLYSIDSQFDPTASKIYGKIPMAWLGKRYHEYGTYLIVIGGN